MEPVRYVSGLYFAQSSQPITCNHPDFLPTNLNDGCANNSLYIYAFAKWTHNPAEAITNFAFVKHDQPIPDGYIKLQQDLNAGRAFPIYLCIRHGDETMPKVTEVSIKAYSEKFEFLTADDWKVFPHDLNERPQHLGKFVYLFYKTRE